MSKLWQMVLRVLALKRRYLGLISGCALWAAWMLFGIRATLLLVILAAIGFFVGRVLEEHESWRDVVEKLLAERYRD